MTGYIAHMSEAGELYVGQVGVREKRTVINVCCWNSVGVQGFEPRHGGNDYDYDYDYDKERNRSPPDTHIHPQP